MKLKMESVGLHYNIELKLSDDLQYRLVMPRPVQMIEGHPLFEIGGVYKAVAYHAIPEPKFNDTRSLLDVFVRSPQDSILEVFRRAIAKGTVDPKECSSIGQKTIDSFFGTNELIRNVDPNKQLDIENGTTTVVIDFTPSNNWEHYQYKDWVGIIDYLTGTQGEMIGHTFKLARDCKVEAGKFVPSNRLFSSATSRVIVFPDNTRPNRLAISGPAWRYHEHLVLEQQPLVAHESYQGEFHGRHLLTGVVSFPDNHQDSLVISKSCAQKLACTVRKRITVQDIAEIKLLVKSGDRIKRGQPVATVIVDGAEKTISNNHYGSEMWDVESIDWTPAIIGGHKGNRLRINIVTVYTCEDGDKLTSRYGGKGVVKVLADAQMPKIDGTPLDILVHPMSFNSRRNLGTFREMMVNKLFWSKYVESGYKTVVRVKHFDNKYSMEQLVSQGLGNLTTLDNGKQIFVAPLYWLRTDKHAREQVSVVTEAILNQDGIKPDSGKLSGVRLSMNFSTILVGQGMSEVHAALFNAAMEDSTATKVGDLLASLH